MQIWQMILIAIGVLIVTGAVAWWIYERNRTRHLRERFGPEYDRRIALSGNRRRAESELAASEIRAQKLKTQPLSATDRSRFLEAWRLCQARFVDDPGGAVNDAERLLTDIMRTRGYRVDDPYERLTDVCAAYPDHATSYREANAIAVDHQRGGTTTENLRKAFLDYRSLFDDVLGGRDEELKRAS